VAGAAYMVVITAAMLILPPVNEVPSDFSATTLWNFRLASLGIETVLWTALGLTFGFLAERRLLASSLNAVGRTHNQNTAI
jgi:Probable cobalt transporter subunit (CbtA)